MTLNLESLVGVVSVVTLNWQEPPPWMAEPLRVAFMGAPTAMEFILVISKPYWEWQGYCSAVMGAVSMRALSWLKITGSCMVMWALAAVARKAAAMMVDRKDILMVIVLKL
jgi:hypothetical protein